MILVVDAKVAVKWFVSLKAVEEDTDRALSSWSKRPGGGARMVQLPHVVAEVTPCSRD